VDSDSSWSVALADYIRNNDQSLQEASRKVLAMFQDELLPCETFAEFCDVAGTANDILLLTPFLIYINQLFFCYL